MLSIHAFLRLAGRIVSAEKLMVRLFVHVFLNILVTLRIAIQSAPSALIVL